MFLEENVKDPSSNLFFVTDINYFRCIIWMIRRECWYFWYNFFPEHKFFYITHVLVSVGIIAVRVFICGKNECWGNRLGKMPRNHPYILCVEHKNFLNKIKPVQRGHCDKRNWKELALFPFVGHRGCIIIFNHYITCNWGQFYVLKINF